MTNEELKSRIGGNIARLRKEKRMTQAELAERLNYSDKAVSKWERGESMPDVMTLMVLAEQFGTDVNELLYEQGQVPTQSDAPEPTAPEVPVPEKRSAARRKLDQLEQVADKGLIQKLSSVLVWTVVIFLYLVLDSFGVGHLGMLVLTGIIANAIVLLSLRSVWKLYGINRLLISVIMWGSMLYFYLMMRMIWDVDVWRIFLLGVPGQLAILGWFKMFRRPEQEGEDTHE